MQLPRLFNAAAAVGGGSPRVTVYFTSGKNGLEGERERESDRDETNDHTTRTKLTPEIHLCNAREPP